MIKGIVHAEDRVVLFSNKKNEDDKSTAWNEKYKCRLSKIISDSVIVVESDKTFDFDKNVCYETYIYSANKLYRCNSYFKADYTEGRIKKTEIEIVSPLERIQRRKHKRYVCHEKFSYSVLQNGTVHDIIEEKELLSDTLVDISGGGIRFKSEKFYEKGIRLLCDISLGAGKCVNVVCEVVASFKLQNEYGMYDIRMKYIGISEEERKNIIKYVFELERS